MQRFPVQCYGQGCTIRCAANPMHFSHSRVRVNNIYAMACTSYLRYNIYAVISTWYLRYDIYRAAQDDGLPGLRGQRHAAADHGQQAGTHTVDIYISTYLHTCLHIYISTYRTCRWLWTSARWWRAWAWAGWGGASSGAWCSPAPRRCISTATYLHSNISTQLSIYYLRNI